MPKQLSPVWFMKKPIDLEHKQYVLLDYMQEVSRSFDNEELEPYFDAVRSHVKNLDTFLTIRGILKTSSYEFTEEDTADMEYVMQLSDNHPDMQEVYSIVKWSLKELKELQKKGTNIWKYVESVLSMSYIGNRPRKISKGFMFVRFPGSFIVETFRFTKDKSGVKLDFIGYDDNKLDNYSDVLSKYSDATEQSAYVVVEPTRYVDTKSSLLPVVKQVLKNQVINEK